MSSENIKVSVIIPAYNTTEYINCCVVSVLNQTHENLEIILVDDGSEDDTWFVCKELASNNHKISAIHQKNSGVSIARKTGLEAASGDYVMFIDSDDWIDANMVKTMLETLIIENADVIECKFIKEFPSGKKTESTDYNKKLVTDSEGAIERLNYGKIFQASMCNKLFDKSLISPCFFKEGVTIGEDYRFVFEIFSSAKNIAFIPIVFYHYVQRMESASYTGYTNNGFEIIHNYTDIKNTIIEKYPRIRSSAIAFWALQEMAVLISMIKSNSYDAAVISKVCLDMKKTCKDYLKIKEVPVHLKICSLLLVINPKLLILLYKYLFRKRYQIS